jgi:hypothetical protein
MRFAILLALLLVSCASIPGDKAAVESVVRSYITAYQEQHWDDLVSLMHPETIKSQRDGILAALPARDADVTEAKRPEVDLLLKDYDVSSIREARKLPPEELVLRMLRHSSELSTMRTMKKVSTTVENVSIEQTAHGMIAEVSMVSKLGEMERRGVTEFLLERVNGRYLVVAMSKTQSDEP